MAVTKRVALCCIVLLCALSLWLLYTTEPRVPDQPRFGRAIVTEFMARNNSTLTDEDGDYSDWIEIQNAKDTDVDLGGWYLTDDDKDLTRWQFPNIVLAGDDHLIVFASGKDRAVVGSALHTNFKLKSSGEYLALVGPDGWTIVWEYAPEYPPQIWDTSYGLDAALNERYFRVPTPGSANGSGSSEPQSGMIVLSEFMACNQSASTDEDGDYSDWIEIHNAEHTDVDLGGWYLTDDAGDLAKWRFPTITLTAGSYLVLFASNKDRAVTGSELHTNFRLRASGEHLALVRPDGRTIAWEYAPAYPPQSGDVSYGLDVALNERYFTWPTPGAPNGSASADMGPIISNASHAPFEPTAGDAITVSISITEAVSPVVTATLHYRVMYSDTIAIPMRDDGAHGDSAAGDGIYGAAIPGDAHRAGNMVRYYVTAADAKGHISRWPLFHDSMNSPEYFGTMITDPSVTSALPVFYWFVERHVDAKTRTGTRASVFHNGDFYDNVYVRVRGASAEYWRKKNFKFDFNKGYYFRFSPDEAPVEEFNLNSTYSDKAYVRRILAWETYRDAGVPYCVAVPVRVQRNGMFYSVAIFVEQPDRRYLERQGLDPEGALYKMFNGLWSATEFVEKVTRIDEDNSDLQALKEGHKLSGTERENYLFDNVDIPAAINYLAATAIMHDRDCGHKNYYLYRDTEETGEWTFLPWDKDLTFGRNVVDGEVLTDTIWADQYPPLKAIGENRLIRAFYETPRIRDMYSRRLRTLMDQLLQPPNTPAAELRYERRIDELFAQMQDDVALDAKRWSFEWGSPQTFSEAIGILKTEYLAARRVALYSNRGPVKDSWVLDTQLGTAAVVAFGTIEADPSSGNQDEEYFTLVNSSSEAIDISGWTVDNNIAHIFRPGVVVPAGGTLYVSPDVVAFRSRTTSPTGAEGHFVQGGYCGWLSDTSGTLELHDTQGTLVDSVTFGTEPSPAGE